MNNRNIFAVLGFIALVFATGFSFVKSIINPITPTGEPTYYGELFGCCMVVWIFLFVILIFNKINHH